LGLSDVEAGLNHLKTSLRGIEGAAKSLSTLGGLTSAVGVASIGAIAVAIGELTKGAINSAAEFGKLAQKAGAPVEELSALAYSARLSEVSVDDLRIASKFLSEELERTGRGGASLLQ